MDLSDRLVDFIVSLGGEAKQCRLGFLAPEDILSLQLDPGSKVIQSYFNGSAEMAMNYSLAMRSDDFQHASETLNNIADKLTNLKQDCLPSDDNSFQFDHIEITGYPFNQIIDNTGNMYWITNFVVYITKFNN
jgi:hypothetical protein